MTTPPSHLPLRPELLEALQQLGYTDLTPIQAQALPAILNDLDVLGQAETGSGKTAAYGLGLLQVLDPSKRDVQSLVLCPTRELADQVAEELRRLAQRLANTRVVVLCGGRPFRDQRLALEAGAHIVVGTPGRIADHLRRRVLSLKHVGIVVIDEADRMLDMGFIDEVQEVVDQSPRRRQTLLFSATFPDRILELSQAVQEEPHRVTVSELVAETQLIQRVIHCDEGQRSATVVSVLAHEEPASALVFCETRNDCDRLAQLLARRGASAMALHGGLEQRDRDDALLQFSNGSVRVLVATDVASRGIDIPELPLVIVAQLSPDPTSYVHRIGRTGRAGSTGRAITLVEGPNEQNRLRTVTEHLGHELEVIASPPGATRLDTLAATHRTLMILAGKKDKIRKGDVVGALVRDGGIPAEALGQIDLSERSIAVAVAVEHAAAALDFLKRSRVKKKKVRALLLG